MARFAPPKTGNDLMVAHGYMAASIIGVLMMLVGAALAINQTPEPAFVWTGAVAFLVGVVGDRLLKIAVGREGAELTFADRQAALDEAITEAESNAPVVPVTAAGQAQALIGGSFWSQPAVDYLRVAAGSNSSIQVHEALERLSELSAAGTAVVRLDDGPQSTGD